MIETMDFDALYTVLLQASRQSFKDMIREYKDETFYTFGFLHEPLWGYIVSYGKTEENLLIYTKSFMHEWAKPNKSFDEMKKQLRWSTGGSYTGFDDECFKPVKEILNLQSDYARNRSLDNFSVFNGQMIETLYKVMTQLNGESIFGGWEERKRIVFNIYMFDQDSSWLEHARRLNSRPVYLKWIEEL